MVEPGKTEVQDAPLPRLRDGAVLVRITYVALNPADWKSIDYLSTPGATVGCDFAGIVEEIGPKAGDSFAVYTVADSGLAFKIADNVSDEDAAGMNVATLTVCLSLYQKLGLPMPGSVAADFAVLLYGGSSAMGSLAIQLAQLSGATVITTCSAKNFDFVKSLGADQVFDYNDPGCAKRIREVTKDSLHHIMDCIGDAGAKICMDAMSALGGQLVTINSRSNYDRDDVRLKPIVAYSAMGETYRLMGRDFPLLMEEYDLAKMYFRLMGKLLGEGKIKPHPPNTGLGLEGILRGLDEMRQGKVSGAKLTYKI